MKMYFIPKQPILINFVAITNMSIKIES